MKVLSDLSPRTLALAGFATICAYIFVRFLWQIIFYRFLHPLAKFPGPFWASVTRLWLLCQDLKSSDFEKSDVKVYHRLFKKYGPVVRISPTYVMVNDATALPQIYHRQVQKSPQYITGNFGATENIVDTRDWRAHSTLRKAVGGPYSFSNVKRLEPLISDCISYWFSQLDSRFSQTRQQFDLALWTGFLAFDVLAEIGFGKPFGFMETGTDVNSLIKSFHTGLLVRTFLVQLYPLTAFLKKTPLRRYMVASADQDFGIGVLMRFRDKLIAERVQDLQEGRISKNDRIDLLQHFLDARYDDDGRPLSLEQVKAEALFVIMAGSDTTATAFSSLVYYVLSHPRVHAKLVAEVREATAAGFLSSMPAYDEVVEHCPYTIAVIREVLRLAPPASGNLPRLVGPGGLDIAGQHIPEGVEVACSPWIVNRDPAIYGADAYEFRPERWLESEEKTKLYLKYSMTFGYGARVCLGKEVVFMELFKGPVVLFRDYDIEPVRKGVDMGRKKIKAAVTWWDDFPVTIRKREGEKA